MLRQFVLMCLSLVFSVLPTCSLGIEGEPAAMNRIRAMTFNIRYNNPNDGQDAWPNRKSMVADLIREHADIAGLQEAQLDQIQDLEKQLPEFAWYGVGRNDGQQSGEFCPVFYRRDRFELLQKETRWLSETPEIPGSKSWDTAITRLVTIVQLQDRESGAKCFFLNTHLDHLGAVAREKGADLIKQQLGRLEGKLPVIVTGDFNCTPDQKPYAVMTAPNNRNPAAKLVDTRSVSQQPPQGPDSTWSGFREVVPGRRIDFVFVGPGVEVRSHRTLGDRVQGRFPSDHLPVVVELALPRR